MKIENIEAAAQIVLLASLSAISGMLIGVTLIYDNYDVQPVQESTTYCQGVNIACHGCSQDEQRDMDKLGQRLCESIKGV